MTRIQKKILQYGWFHACVCIFLFGSIFIWTVHCRGEELFSYNSIPTTMTVAFTGAKTPEKWITMMENAPITCQTLPMGFDNWSGIQGETCKIMPVKFKEYLKEVVSHEWNRKKGKDEALDFLKAGALSAKTRAWGLRDLRKYQGLFVDKDSQTPIVPDVQNSIVDQMYIQSHCDGSQGENDPVCMGETWKRTPIVDTAVEETWDTILKRHDCFSMFGKSKDYPVYKEKCPDVFETNYNVSVDGCKGLGSDYAPDLWVSQSCIPQNNARTLVNDDHKSYQEVLTKYYGDLSLYEQPNAVPNEVEALSSCLLIQFTLDEWSKYKCFQKRGEPTTMERMHFISVTERDRLVCQEGSDNCPLGEKYIDVGTRGKVLEQATKIDKKTGRKEVWYHVQWKVKPGSEVSDDLSESGHTIEGWSRDKNIKPIASTAESSLIIVQVIGARVKAKV